MRNVGAKMELSELGVNGLVAPSTSIQRTIAWFVEGNLRGTGNAHKLLFFHHCVGKTCLQLLEQTCTRFLVLSGLNFERLACRLSVGLSGCSVHKSSCAFGFNFDGLLLPPIG